MFCDIERAMEAHFRVIQDRFCDVQWRAHAEAHISLHRVGVLSLKPNNGAVPLDNGSYFDLTTADVASIRRQTLTTLGHGTR